MSINCLPRCLTIMLAALLCVACTTSSAGSRYYVLNPVAVVEMPAPMMLSERRSIAISLLRLPQYLDRQQIVTRNTGNELKLAESDRWGGNPEKNMLQVVNTNLSGMLAATGVIIIPASSDVLPQQYIEIEITRFERFPDGKVYLSAVWQLLDHSGALLADHSLELSSANIADASDYDAIVASMSDLLGRLSHDIATAIIRPQGS